jgi:rhamnulokinase
MITKPDSVGEGARDGQYARGAAEMENPYFLAIDIGASNGRHVLGRLDGGKLRLEIVHRFENEMRASGGRLVWDTDALFQAIKDGMKRCAAIGKIPAGVGVDTWGVDFVLLDKRDRPLGDVYAYRDSRTDGIQAEVEARIPWEESYLRTGIQRLPFNTIYQLAACLRDTPDMLEKAKTFLMLPDYFHFLLSGEKASEYTNASTSALINLKTGDWDRTLLGRLGVDDAIFLPVSGPGSRIGPLRAEVAREVGFSCDVVLPATHDTASAVMSMPAAAGETAYISSGTWSLMGCELSAPVVTEKSRTLNFTNEGGYGKTYRYLKNIMGLWMLQSVRRELGKKYSFADLHRLARDSAVSSAVDCDDNRFIAPVSMMDEIRACCAETGVAAPETPGDFAAVIYNSLASCYGRTLRELEETAGRRFAAVSILGGGANADFLNELTAAMTGCDIYAGPEEATSIGNLLAQMIQAGQFADLAEARACVAGSFDIRKFGRCG